MKKNSSPFLKLAMLMAPYRGALTLSVILILFANAAQLLSPIVASYVIDDFLRAGKEQVGIFTITGLGIIYLFLTVGGSVADMFRAWVVSDFSQKILHKMRLDVFRKILHMPVSTLDDYGTGKLITRATNDIETVNDFYSGIFINLFKDVFMLIGIIAVIFFLDPMLALVSLSGLPLIILLTFSIRKVIRENFKKVKALIGHINGFISENIAGMRVVQAFNRQKEKHAEFKKINGEYYKASIVHITLHSFLRPTMEVINNLVIAFIIISAYGRTSVGLLEVGVVYAFTDYAKRFFEPINDLAEKYTNVQSAFVSVDRIYEILNTKTEEPDEGSHGGEVKGHIEFRDVWFAYKEGNYVLRGVSFALELGESAAFVGATGAGKTTIISLLCRYYDIEKGQILVDGVDIRDWRLRDLREGIAAVMQNVFLFDSDIRQNVDMASGYSDGEIEAAIATANADEFVSAAGGLDGRVYEQGQNFSTGQRQLLSFARAVVGSPGVLVLDEATANIDTNTEEKIRVAIERISEGRTSIFIAHRLSTIRFCKKIFVLSDGVLKEQGDHESLMAQNGLYASLVRAAEEEENV